jgi:hypothetical protein
MEKKSNGWEYQRGEVDKGAVLGPPVYDDFVMRIVQYFFWPIHYRG